MVNFKSIPFLRILFPYILGIVFSLEVGVLHSIHLLLLISFSTFLIAFLFQYFYKPTFYFKKGIFIFCTNIFLFLLANEAYFQYKDVNRSNHYSHHLTNQPQQFFVNVTDIPVKTGRYTKLTVNVEAINFKNRWTQVDGKTIVYLQNYSGPDIELGQELLIESKFTTVNPPKNPYEFDYKSFLENRNIFQVVYAKPDQVAFAPTLKQYLSFNQLGASIKHQVVSTLRNSGLSPEAFSIAAALLVGYDDEIDSDVMQSFSHSGTLHVLSVSGMHTGVLFGIFVFLFGLFDKNNRYKKVKCICVIAGLFLFVLITGFSPAVLRAALMLSLIVVGQTFYKQGNGFNTLFLSAFLLLLANPCLVNDVGFLLSYTAVFGIMYLYPILSQRFYFSNWLLQKINSLTLMSVSATLFTLPISLYYFHQFPTWFVLSNLLIIPLSTVQMIAAIALVCLSKIVIIKSVLVFCMNRINALMLWFARLTDEPGYGYIDNLHFSTVDFLYLSFLIVLFLWIIYSKQYKTVIFFLTVCASWLITNIYFSYRQAQEKELVVFYVKQKPAYVFRDGTKIYASLDSLSSKEKEKHIKPYLLALQHYHLIPIKADLLQQREFVLEHLTQKDLPTINSGSGYILVSNNSPLNPTDLFKNKPLVIADCSNSYTFVRQLKKQCALADIPFYSVKEQGALRISL